MRETREHPLRAHLSRTTVGDKNSKSELLPLPHTHNSSESGTMTAAQEENITTTTTSLYRDRGDLPDAPGFSCVATWEGHSDMVTSVKFAEDGARVVSGSADATACLWDVEKGSKLAVLEVESSIEQNGGITCVDFAGDGATLVTSSDDRMARLWDTRAPNSPASIFKGHTHVVSSCSLAPSGHALATGSFDETVRLWDVRKGGCVGVIPAHSDPVLCVKYSRGHVRPHFASTSMDGTCRIWSSHTKECLRTILPTNEKSERAPVVSARFTPNNQYVMMNSLHNKILLFDPVIDGRQETANRQEDQGPIPVLKKTYEGHLNRNISLKSVFMTRCEDGAKLVLSGSEDHHVYAWSLNTRECVGLLRGRAGRDAEGDGHCDVVMGIDASEGRPLVATGGGPADRAVKLWAKR
jgi:COMPASS component SWD3